MKKQFKRKIGKYTVTLDFRDSQTRAVEGQKLNRRIYEIEVEDDWFTNTGVVYDHAVERLRRGDYHPLQKPQLTGMDSGLTKTVRDYIHKMILKYYEV